MVPRKETFVPNGIASKFPTYRDKEVLSVIDWIEGKKVDEGAEGLWRINDQLYDLSGFVDKHPGGKYWLEMTKGTDITELFEVHHLSDNPKKMLPKFHMRDAKTPRPCKITFNPDGFYMTLKEKVKKMNIPSGPSLTSKLMTDTIMAIALIIGVFSTWWGWKWAVVSGLFLTMGIIASHNFTHFKDNWRMYYMNLSLMHYKDWRISHVLSHHMFPNTIYDLELSMWEPVFIYLPESDKSLLKKYVPWLLSPLVFVAMFHKGYFRRVSQILFEKSNPFHPAELFGLGIPVVLSVLGGTSLWVGFQMWTVIMLVASFSFGIIGLTAAHHHPEIYHEGDFLGDNTDFGLVQLAAVRDRVEVTGTFLVLILFGDHALHHFFPTIDHSRLDQIYPAFHETCKQFNVSFPRIGYWNLFKGMYKQLARSQPNAVLTIKPNNKKQK